MTAGVQGLVDVADHVQGPENAPVTLVEYGDFECIHCGRAWHILRDLQWELPQSFCHVFRHFPQPAMHPHAVAAAHAAEAAALQGKFWPMYNLLYENQRFLDSEALQAYAETLGLDVAAFEADRHGGTVAARVARDAESARANGVRGTPTFFLNGRNIGGAWDLEALRSAIMRAGDVAAG